MALATTCPKCQTSFRVAPDQLALRRGMVRCGVCQNVFSGMANLRHVDEILRQRSSARAAAQQVLHPAPRDSELPGSEPPLTAQPPGAAPPASTSRPSARVERTTRDAAASVRHESSPDFPQTDLRTAFFLPETVFGPITQTPSEPARFSTEPAAAAESIQPAQPAQASQAEPTPTAEQGIRAGRAEHSHGQPIATEMDLIAGTVTGERSPEDSTNSNPEPAIALRRPGPDTRIRWAQESDQAKREADSDGLTVTRETSGMPRASTLQASLESAGLTPMGSTIGTDSADSSTSGIETASSEITGARTGSAHTAEAALSAQEPAPASRQKRRRKRPVDRSDEAIAYFEPDASHIGFSSRAVAMGWLICLFAAVLLMVQLVLASRNVLAASLPLLRAPLQAVAGWVGLEIEPPRDLQAVTIESFELHVTAIPGQLALSALLRNRAGHAVQWPALEVALTDGQGTLLVRKVLLPRDYFPGLPAGTSQPTELGMNPRAELPLKLTLEARDLAASGYSVTLFYP